MIFDRTQSDVDTAISIRKNKIQKFLTLTESEITSLERGMLTHAALNRVENKQSELKGLLNGIGYWNTQITNKSWSLGNEVNIKDYQRIINNETKLVNAFFTYSDTPNIPNSMFSFTNMNAIEKILFDLDVMINDVKSNYRECGTFESGE